MALNALFEYSILHTLISLTDNMTIVKDNCHIIGTI